MWSHVGSDSHPTVAICHARDVGQAKLLGHGSNDYMFRHIMYVEYNISHTTCSTWHVYTLYAKHTHTHTHTLLLSSTTTAAAAFTVEMSLRYNGSFGFTVFNKASHTQQQAASQQCRVSIIQLSTIATDGAAAYMYYKWMVAITRGVKVVWILGLHGNTQQ